MKSVPLTIPFLVLSTKINESGDVEKHILTPFGNIDVVFRIASERLVEGWPQVEVEVQGDIENWMLDETLIDEFKHCIVDFVGRITRETLDHVTNMPKELSIHFKGADFDLKSRWIQNDFFQPNKRTSREGNYLHTESDFPFDFICSLTNGDG